VRDRAAKSAPDLIERNFTATAPNRLWVADISYIPTWAGFLYLAVVLDAFSRKIVGWAIDRGNLAQGFVGYRRGHQDFNVTD
jgi:putative transposase